MEITSIDSGNGAENEETTTPYYESYVLSKGKTMVWRRCRRKFGPGVNLITNTGSSSMVRITSRELYLLNMHVLFNAIPKHITTMEEKYALRCFESIRKCALRSAARNFDTKVGANMLSEASNFAAIDNLSSNSMGTLAIESPSGVGSHVAANSSGDWNIGTVSGSPSMINILKSPLLQKFGSVDVNVISGQTDLRQKEVSILDNTYLPRPMHRKDASISTTTSTSSDESSSPAYSALFQGMLQCVWKDRLPYHIFTMDDKREVYVATAETSSRIKSSDFIYTFRFKRDAEKECDNNLHELDLEIVAKMQVSTSITLSSSESEVWETQFVLSVSSHSGETQYSDNSIGAKNKRLARKVKNAFRSSHFTKQRSRSGLLGSSSFVFKDTCVADSDARNFELATIVVKDTYRNYKKAELGGWGLKFLKKSRNNPSLDTFQSSEECTTVIIPAGIHGGPNPSSLTERWISGGHCDCGGWDLGCPVRILNATSNTEDYSFSSNIGKTKTVDIFLEGSKHSLAPAMKMVSIREGLYYIRFQPTLSALQSFAVAVAIIHSRTQIGPSNKNGGRRW
ncbi:uncharacterized protein LOC127250627 [Andrographis paniculata]|uniref:uncharacterized protein LOC127250627 n=1 Tax=Andrographis paniculata TaxID=175694 RepID=UPI0021E8B0E6|nr:uncharacterized protein LOC127250627 [Andrographis paniculata]XP_051129961.1 uncharacterized protein LOC127250627 [Andrographis paniculata]XP_051129963.1 uncharacterized protein LOC127250627 [Andrographis paniculata]